MQIETLQGSSGGVKYNIAPGTTFDAVKVDANSDTTLTDVIASLQEEKETVTSIHGGYAIPMTWADGNPAGDNRTGKFVTLAGQGKIKIATSTDSIYGVTTQSAAYIENYSDISGDPSKAYVCLFGGVSVVCKDNYTNTDLQNGVKVTISEAGNAIKVNTEFGYQVTDIIDSTHVMMLMMPNLDTINRLVSLIQNISLDSVSDLAAQVQSINARFPENISLSVQNGDVVISHDDTVTDDESDTE